METLKYILIKLVDWKTRQRKIQYLTMLLGAGVLSVNKYLGQSLTLQKGDLQLALSMSEGNIITDYFVNIVAIFIILGGFIWLLIDAYQEAKITVRKKVVVIEGLGLRKVMTKPLHKTAAKHFAGKIDRLDIDITQRIRDGEVIYPQDTFNNNIKTIVSNIATRIDGIDHQDLTLVYGGLLPVPFTFYIGAILDDNGPVSVFDWDRTQEDWRLIDNNTDDDHTSFTITEEPQDYPSSAEDVVLAVSVSYLADIAGIRRTFPHYPVSHLALDSKAFGNHWSLSKQSRLSLQFTEHAKTLTARGVKRIHVILAAPSSIALNFGRRYDNRNLAQALVYQYEKNHAITYPWAVEIPAHGTPVGSVLMTPEPACVS
ncbi:SAVED domain-containing protein [Serratia liquefaciens]|uniref:SAVED domain-containing protein n=1 Tax=Serratia liquefaciens TaxID=614 RepID=UPI00235F7FEB|nr:SAVED domain-containing protein [Serratia liquefaciens]